MVKNTFFSNCLVVRGISAMLLGCLAYCGGAAAQRVTLVQQVNQAPAAPILWQVPEAIPFGTALSALQLNAASATVGTFAYQPAVGTILPSGTTTLSVVLFPLNQNYATESASVPIIVMPPGSSSFTITPLSASSPEHPVALQPGMPATVQIEIGPIGDFHQPVTLSCNAPLLGRSCLFSPAVIRPTTSTILVSLTLVPVHSAAASRSSMNLPPVNSFNSEGLLPGITSSALFGMLFFGRRWRRRTSRTETASVLLALPLLAMLSGCGARGYFTVQKVEIRGSSLRETHIAQIYVVDDAHSPWGKRRARFEGEER